MLKTISRYGVRVVPGTEPLIARLAGRGQLVKGPHLEEFQAAFAGHFGAPRAVATSCGRMAFYYLLRALDLAPGGEVIVPAFTFWVVPEMVRAAGLTPVFADVDPDTFNITADTIRQVITPKSVAVVPTHLWGLPCDMAEIMSLARAHDLRVIEDCAETLGATYRGQQVGTIGDAGFYSLQTIKPLNTYNGGMAVCRDQAVLDRVAAMVERDPWPDEAIVRKRLLRGRIVRNLVRPEVFRWTLYPVLRAGARLGIHPDVYFWEKIRPLSPIPLSFSQRYSNVQAAIGLEGLKHFDQWTRQQQGNAAQLTAALADVPGLRLPRVPADRTHIFYQYCVYVPSPESIWRRCLRRGVDLEALHVDNCARLPLFAGLAAQAPGADATAEAMQVPVYASLGSEQIDFIASVVAGAVREAGSIPSAASAASEV